MRMPLRHKAAPINTRVLEHLERVRAHETKSERRARIKAETARRRADYEKRSAALAELTYAQWCNIDTVRQHLSKKYPKPAIFKE